MRMKFAIITGIISCLGLPLAAQAQGIIGGADQGAADGSRAAGPVGGVVGGTIGGVAGGVGEALSVPGQVLGIPPQNPRYTYRSAYHRHHHHRHHHHDRM